MTANDYAQLAVDLTRHAEMVKPEILDPSGSVALLVYYIGRAANMAREVEDELKMGFRGPARPESAQTSPIPPADGATSE